MVELNDTIDLMQSGNYKGRFIAEYWQTKIRCDRLHQMIIKYDAGTLGFEPSCRIDLLRSQRMMMEQYLEILEIRAEIENIDLTVAEREKEIYNND